MGKNKRFYWIKLNTNFFIQREVKSIRRTENGLLYIVIYLKLLLLSANTGGILKFENTEDNLIEELSIEIDEEPEDVKKAIEVLQKKNLITISSNDEFFLNKAPDMVGSETASTIRSRESRQRKKERESQSNNNLLHCNNTQQNCNTEIEEDKRDKREDIYIKDIDDIKNIITKINELVINQISSSSLENFINNYGVDTLNKLIKQIERSDYLKENINFNNLNDEFVNNAISGKYRTYKNEVNNEPRNKLPKDFSQFNL